MPVFPKPVVRRALTGASLAGAVLIGSLGVNPNSEIDLKPEQIELTVTQQDSIARLYNAAFLREPDTGGLNYWLDQHRRGRTLTAIANDFARSREFSNRYGRLDSAGFIRQLYRNVMGRDADSGGLNYWLGQVSHGRTRGWVMVGFSESNEFVEAYRARQKPNRPGQPSPGHQPVAPGGSTNPPATPPTTSPSAPAPSPAPSSSHVDSVVYDMYGPPLKANGQAWGAHEALPKGLPSHFDFYRGARGGVWNGTQGTGRAVSAWGQLFEAEPGTGTFDVRLQVRNHRLYFLLNDGRWVQQRPHLVNTAMEGAWWNGTFQSQGSSPVRNDGANGSSVSLRDLQKSNHATWHFWWNGWYPREVIPANAVGVYAVADMRLIPDTNSNVNMAQAKFIASVGVDNYSGATYNSGGEAIDSVMQPRMKWVTSSWKSFSGTNLSEAQLRQNPPPAG